MQAAVIGSGPAGMACVKALIRAGLTPTLIDVGDRLPDGQQAAVGRMSALPAEQWDAADRALVTDNPTLFDPDVPKKMVFGSDYYFGGDRDFSPIDTVSGMPSASFARGDFRLPGAPHCCRFTPTICRIGRSRHTTLRILSPRARGHSLVS